MTMFCNHKLLLTKVLYSSYTMVCGLLSPCPQVIVLLTVQSVISFVNIFCYLCLSLPYCHVCSLQPCGHLLGEGMPLGSIVGDVFRTKIFRTNNQVA